MWVVLCEQLENLIPAAYTFYGIARITSDVAEAVRQFSFFREK